METKELAQALDNLRATTPLVHNITNYVTVNDCANALLAIGGSPIMSDDVDDVVDITTICGALVLNIGTLNSHTIAGMKAAGARASELGHPIVLDPVGAGASRLRTETAAALLDTLAISIVRGNVSEIKALALGAASTRGVDACPDDAVTRENASEVARFCKEFAARTGTVVAATGTIDIVADANRAFAVFNGSAMQGRITGAGCMLSSITGAYAQAYAQDTLIAALAAVATTGVAGDVAEQRMGAEDGNGSFRTYLLDALCNLQGADLAAWAKIEEL